MGLNSFQQFLRTRRSVRRFLPRAVSQDVLERILETALWAPSAHNRQPWRFVVLLSQEEKIRLADGMGEEFRIDLIADGQPVEKVEAQVKRSKARIRQAPVVIVLCFDPSEIDEYPDQKRQQAEHQMGAQSVAMAGGTLLLAAYAEGLGGVWVCAPLFAPEAVRRALDLPGVWEPQGMLFLGYPEVIPSPRKRKPLSEVVRFR